MNAAQATFHRRAQYCRDLIAELQGEIEEAVERMAANEADDLTDVIEEKTSKIEYWRRKIAAHESAALIAQDQDAGNQAVERRVQVRQLAETAYQLAAKRTGLARQMQEHLAQIFALKTQFDEVDHQCHSCVASVGGYHYGPGTDRNLYTDGRAPAVLFDELKELYERHAHSHLPAAACEWKEGHIRQMLKPWLPAPEEKAA